VSHHHQPEIYELRDKIRELAYFLLGEELMAQVQYTLTLTVTPALPPPNPLTLGATSGSATLAQGTQGSDILTPVTLGVPPYSAAVDAASPSALPPGVTVGIDANNNLIVSGNASIAGGPSTIVIDVNDSAPAVPVSALKK
jgi:hypothetical protein